MARPPLRKPVKKVAPVKVPPTIDYKDTATLRKFISDRGKIRSRRVTGVSVQDQRLIAKAVKNAREVALLRPRLVLPVGKLAITQFVGERPLAETIGQQFPIEYAGHALDCIPLPHPSGASPWHRMEPGKTMLQNALQLVAKHPAIPLAAKLPPSQDRLL